MGARPNSRNPRALRDHPPLVIALSLLLAMLSALPSSLNLPRSDPAETLEYAPVPPENQDAPPPSGNFSTLGLGASSSTAALTEETPPETPSDGAIGGRAVKSPSTKRCVGNPPRQTEDPLSPPCVSRFEGDNFGSTYIGVARDEVRVLFYIDSSSGGRPLPGSTSRADDEWARTGYVDFLEPAADNEEPRARMLRVWQRYFNERYQTYGRLVHFFAYFNGGARTPEQRRADAVDNLERIRPFAVVNFAATNTVPYVAAMTRRGVLVFAAGSFGSVGESKSYFTSSRGLIWSFDPTIEHRARLFTSWVCRKVVPFAVSSSGSEFVGRPRKLGLLSQKSDRTPELEAYARLIRSGIQACGGNFAVDVTFPQAQVPTQSPQPAIDNIARFRTNNVTTIIWAGGGDSAHSQQAARTGYFPEWIVAPDGLNDTTFMAQFQDQTAWQYAWVMTPQTRQGQPSEQQCSQAAKEADPAAPQIDVTNWGCPQYPYVQHLFIAIQVAGPRLGPPSIEKGFRAIPPIASSNPSVPACFYEPNDYTCVKDAMAEWWDPDGRDPAGNRPGCWRMPEGGRRYLTGYGDDSTWPATDLAAERNLDSDVCNAQGAQLG